MSGATGPILNVAFYQFVRLGKTSSDLYDLRSKLKDETVKLGLKGTILLSPEGINAFLAGESAPLRQWIKELEAMTPFRSFRLKESYSQTQPFRRMLVRLKKEIISMGAPMTGDDLKTAPRLMPEELREWIRSGKEFVALDTRNDYEIRLGKFKGAVDLQIQTFRDFPDRLRENLSRFQDKPVVMYCTGGIRCEKAGALGLELGLKDVYQLDDGILGYFEKCGNEGYEGECFVFDQRVAVDGQLAPTPTAQCFECRNPLTPEEQQSPLYELGKSCPYCAALAARAPIAS